MTNTPLPYVYKAVNCETGQFYFGMRSANKLPASLDLGVFYFSSNKTIQSNKEMYSFHLLSEFDEWESAFLFENNLIRENWGNPLLLNKHYQNNPSTFSMLGFRRTDVSDLNKKRLSKPKETRQYNCSNCGDAFYKIEYCHVPKAEIKCCSKSCARVLQNGKNVGIKITKKQPKDKRISWNKGKNKHFDERIAKYANSISETMKGRKPWNYNKSSPKSKQNGIAGAEKLSKKCIGRKRHYNEDGSWTWVYPE